MIMFASLCGRSRAGHCSMITRSRDADQAAARRRADRDAMSPGVLVCPVKPGDDNAESHYSTPLSRDSRANAETAIPH
jgi:hypothetical protein